MQSARQLSHSGLSRPIGRSQKPLTPPILPTARPSTRVGIAFDPFTCRSAPAEASSSLSDDDGRPSTSRSPSPSLGPTAHRARIQSLVEISMLAAFSGLAYTLFTTVGLDRYVGYFLPMPVIIASARNGVAAGIKTVSATTVLLVALQGPFKALTYLLVHGLLSFTMGAMWANKVPWAISVPLTAAARVLGSVGYIGLSSFVMNENLYSLLLNNVLLVLDNIAATVGAAAAPPLAIVVAVILAIMLVNALVYVLLSHILYTLLLSQMGIAPGKMPRFAERLVYGSAGPGQR